MDKQDALAAVIERAFDDYNASVFAVSLPYDVRRAGTIQAIAAGVRSSVMASRAVELIARAMAGPIADEMVQAGNQIGEPCDVPFWMLWQPEARAALSAAIGEDIGGGRG